MTFTDADATAVAAAMATGQSNPAMQQIQTRYRLGLAAAWGIAPGATVLEVGCGQGDMTAALAHAVGPGGRVVGVDPAGPDYGAPVTLGDSVAHLLATPLGKRIEIRLGLDVLDAPDTFAPDTFDHVVISHAAWYFASLHQLTRTLAVIRPWARQLCFAEWDLRARTPEQLPHLLAVLVQGQIEANGSRGEGNVRTLFSRRQLLRILDEAGWTAGDVQDIDATGMHDADWEIGSCRALLADAARLAAIPPAVLDLVRAEGDTLEEIARDRGNAALPAYAVVATRG
ncbi:class I SAM-dependent methyltransferase [Pseudonocardia sp. GCM10023141]|uniref:class I SAM-dependent methyltransferase n=1 Tax=Pseudonocardia sp. GCM10023141 TaxID=3252653 RepID=UPI003607BB10